MTRNFADCQDESAYLGEYEAGTYLDIQEYFLHPDYDINFNFIPATLFHWGANQEKDCFLYQSLKSGSHAQRDAATLIFDEEFWRSRNALYIVRAAHNTVVRPSPDLNFYQVNCFCEL